MLKKGVYFIPSLFWALIILKFTLQSAALSYTLSGGLSSWIYENTGIFYHNFSFAMFHLFVRKLAHVCEYIILTFFLFFGFSPFELSFKNKITYVVLIAMGFACIDETLQLFVDGRSGSFVDILIDAIGVLLSVVGYLYLVNRKNDIA